MRYSKLFIPTLRDDPADAEVISHKLLLRAGYIRRVTSGVYDYLPLGLRVLRNIEGIIRDEMNRSGAQELLMPMVQSGELWEKSGRMKKYGPELLRFKDRHGHESCLGPTHEEVVCDLVSRELRSYKQLPMNLFQIQAKFRDEIRPRFGLMRGREFIMKDAYSFHADDACLMEEYDRMFATYCRIFERCSVKFRPVEADGGSIGGSKTHEFHVLAESGEDLIAHCSGCNYAANVETAVSTRAIVSGDKVSDLQTVDTPNVTSVEDVAAFLSVNATQLLKTLVYRVTGGADDGAIVAACVLGDDQLQEIKLIHALGADSVEMASDDDIVDIAGIAGFIGPQGLACKVLMDQRVSSATDLVAGANCNDKHVTGLNIARDVKAEYADLRETRAGDSCCVCGGVIELSRGIEVGQVFALGTQYTEPMEVLFQNQQGKRALATMGCYGIGVSRLMAAVVEQCNDDSGIAWPLALAPFSVALISMGKSEAVFNASERMYQQLCDAGVKVLWDERKERPGVKFKDAELIGIPMQIVVGDRGLKEGIVEMGWRKGDRSEVAITDIVGVVVKQLKKA